MKITVLMGGSSSERNVSLASGIRIVLALRDLENFSTSEIAAVLHRKEATIRWRLAEARHRFQYYWGKRHGTAMPENFTPSESAENNDDV